jgi:hypothetical protein
MGALIPILIIKIKKIKNAIGLCAILVNIAIAPFLLKLQSIQIKI